MKVSPKVFGLLTSLVIAIGPISQAQSHTLGAPAPALPIHHALLFTKPLVFKVAPKLGRSFFTPLASSRLSQTQLFALLGRGKSVSSFGLAGSSFNNAFTTSGAGSISARTLIQGLNSLGSQGIAIGESFTPQFNGGVVTNGEVTGHLYFQVLNRLYANTGKSVFAFGSNPLNTGGTGTIVNLPGATNFLTFAPNAGPPGTGHGGTFVPGPFGLGNPISIASRAFVKNYNTLAGASIGLGQKLAPTGFTGGPILGGEFSGTFFLGGVPSALSIDRFVFAFGNNPLNRAFPIALIPNPTNFVSFVGRPNDIIGAGSLFGTGYFRLPLSRSRFFQFGSTIFAVGENPLNIGKPFRVVPISNSTSFLNF